MQFLADGLEKTLGDDIALVVAAVGAFFVVFIQFVRLTTEFKVSPDVRRWVGYGELLGGLGVSVGAIAIAWYSWVAAWREDGIEGWFWIGAPLFPLGIALGMAGWLIHVYRQDEHKTPLAGSSPTSDQSED